MNKKYDYVLGENSYDCGIACIMTILKFYGISSSREKIVKMINKTNSGYTAYDLIKVSKSYDLEGYGIKSTIDNIDKFPVIAHTIKNKNMFHFIVIFEKNDKKKTLLIMDPSIGLTEISYFEFEEMTTNIFLLFHGDKVKNKKDIRFKKEIIKIFQNSKRIILKALFLSLIFIVFSLVFNYYLKIVLTYSSQTNLLFSIFLIFIVISIFKNSINYFKNKLILDLSIQIDKNITKDVTNHIFNLPYEYFISKTTGELVTIIEDIENFKQVVTKVFVLSVVDVILIVFILFYLLFLNYLVALIICIFIIIMLFVTKIYQRVFNDKFINLKMSKIDYSSSLISYFTSFETIKNLNISKKISELLTNKYDITLNYDKKYNTKFYNYQFITVIITDFLYLFLIFLSTYYITHKGINLFDIVLFSSIFYLVSGLLSNITESISFYKVYQTSANRVLDCLEIDSEIFSYTKCSKISSICFKDICYSSGDISILENINLDIIKGEKVFITGESGIGKSTLMKLLLLYLTPNTGKILIDKLDITNLDLSFIRNYITYICQNEKLFSGSIMENFEVVSDDIELINKMSNVTLLSDFLDSYNSNYNFFIEEDGANISGGERKKIILTRGLLHFKNVLILDEVFNEISPGEERIILERIFEIAKNKIVIMVSHRDNNKDLFDKKYIIEGDGRIHEIK